MPSDPCRPASGAFRKAVDAGPVHMTELAEIWLRRRLIQGR